MNDPIETDVGVSPLQIDELYSLFETEEVRTIKFKTSTSEERKRFSSLLALEDLQTKLLKEYETYKKPQQQTFQVSDPTPTIGKMKEQITKTKNFVNKQISIAIERLMKYEEASNVEWTVLHPVWADLNIYKYLVNGEITTRVGKTITRPEITKPSDLKENYTQLTLDLARIYYEWTFDWQGDDPDFYLPYVANPGKDDDKKIAHQKSGQELGDLADGVGAATGTAIAAVFKGILGDRAEIAEIVAPYFVGLYFRKFMEIRVFLELQNKDETRIELGDKPKCKSFIKCLDKNPDLINQLKGS